MKGIAKIEHDLLLTFGFKAVPITKQKNMYELEAYPGSSYVKIYKEEDGYKLYTESMVNDFECILVKTSRDIIEIISSAFLESGKEYMKRCFAKGARR